MRPGYWILDERGEPVPADAETWGFWFESADRHVADDADEQTGWRVSTVFIGLDHNFSNAGPPVLWETLVFGGPLDGEMERYTSRADALEGHRAMCARVTEVIAGGRPINEP